MIRSRVGTGTRVWFWIGLSINITGRIATSPGWKWTWTRSASDERRKMNYYYYIFKRLERYNKKKSHTCAMSVVNHLRRYPHGLLHRQLLPILNISFISFNNSKIIIYLNSPHEIWIVSHLAFLWHISYHRIAEIQQLPFHLCVHRQNIHHRLRAYDLSNPAKIHWKIQ